MNGQSLTELVAEKEGLDERVRVLVQFRNTEDVLDFDDRARLDRQWLIMRLYQDALRERIAAFEVNPCYVE